MIEVRFHGRGGQGSVVASEILASALFKEGKWVQAFPTFGVERRGAPVAAFLRVSERPIRLRCQIASPDHVIILDPTLIPVVDVTSGLKPGGWIIVNSEHPPDSFVSLCRSGWRVATVDAGEIALRNGLGSRTNPIVNTAILGAFAKVTQLVHLASIEDAIRTGVPVRPDENVAAAEEAYHSTKAAAFEEVKS